MKLANSGGVLASSFAESGLRAMASIVAAGFARLYGRSAKDAGLEVSHPSGAVRERHEAPVSRARSAGRSPRPRCSPGLTRVSTSSATRRALASGGAAPPGKFPISERLAGYNQMVLTGVQCWVAPATREG